MLRSFLCAAFFRVRETSVNENDVALEVRIKYEWNVHLFEEVCEL